MAFSMESTNAGSDELWDNLHKGIEKIYTDVKHLTVSGYMELYTHATNLIGGTVPLGGPPGHHATPYDLYNHVNTFLLNYATTLFNDANDLTTEDILRWYNKQWDRFKSSSKVLSHVIPFNNSMWLSKWWPEGVENVYGAYQLAIMAWRDVLLSASGEKVRNGVLDLIEDERRGKPVNISLIRGVVHSYAELDMIEVEPHNAPPELEVYKTAFEDHFLKNTERFYRRLEGQLFEQNPLSEYIKRIEQRIAEEVRRAELFLHASTLKSLVRILCEVLIEKHRDLLYAEFKKLLSEDRHDELAITYRLMSRANNAISNLAASFEAHVWAEGVSAVERLGDKASKDPILYVDTLMRVYRKYNDIVLTAFANNERFVLCFTNACRKYINNNAVTDLAQSLRKTPEFFALYCDTLLRRSLEAPQEYQLDDFLDGGVIAMLEYIDDKDVFQKCSATMMAKRIVQHLSVTEDMEASLMHKLSIPCGDGYVWTLQRIFRDMAASKKLNERFIAHLKNTNGTFSSDFSIHVLASGLWPFRQSSTLKLPQELEHIVQCFTAFYSGLHSTRNLRWLHNVSKVELVTNCFQKRYTLEASTFQMAVLLRYNDGLSLTVNQLQEGTGMDMGVLQKVLKSLLYCKLLTCAGRDTKDYGKLQPDTVVSLFEEYDNKKLRVNVNATLNEELEATRDVTQKMMDDERKILVQAAIVRTMKIRKTLTEEELIAEIVRQLQPKFKASVSIIKECIGNLIEKEYLEKDSSQLNTYNYLT